MNNILGRTCIWPGCGKPIPDEKRIGTGFHDNVCKQKDYRARMKVLKESGMLKISGDESLISMPLKKLSQNHCNQCENEEAIVGQYAGGRQLFTCTRCGFVSKVKQEPPE